MKTTLKLGIALTTVMLIFPDSLKGQQKVTLEEFRTYDRMFRGTIGTEGNTMPITLYLKHYATSPGHESIYSVKGWYYYDQYKQQIPLVGIYNSRDDLTLYQFNDPDKIDTLAQFLYNDFDKRNFWEGIEMYSQMEGFVEKINISFKGVGTWYGQGKELPVEIWAQNIAPVKKYGFLHITEKDEKHHINLQDVDIWPEGNTLHTYKWIDGRLHLLLEYSRRSKSYALGRCGAGTEGGLILLSFDENYRLLAKTEQPLYSCLRHLDSEVLEEKNGVITYRIDDYGDGEGKEVVLDTNKMTIRTQQAQ